MFKEKLAFGKLGESQIASWLRARGHYVLPVYEIEENQGKGPRLFAPSREFIAPDLLVFDCDGIRWIEAKHKTVFTWHRITERWTTGIDRNHWNDYVALAETWPWPIWLLFLHENEEPDDRDKPYCQGTCPVGLFGNDLLYLKDNINHEHENWGRHGMVYWSHEILKEVATLNEVYEAYEKVKHSE